MLSASFFYRLCIAKIAGIVLLAAATTGCIDRAEASEFVLARDGRPAATIVIGVAPTRSAVVAAIELRDHVEKIQRREVADCPRHRQSPGNQSPRGRRAPRPPSWD